MPKRNGTPSHSLVECGFCKIIFQAANCEIRRGGGRYCSPRCGYRAKNTSSPVIEAFGDRFRLDVHGYYVGRKTGKRLHRLIWEDSNGPLPDGYVVHHKNENKSDNRLENLQAMPDPDHKKHHNRVARNHLPTNRMCIIDDCTKRMRAFGLCPTHRFQFVSRWRVLIGELAAVAAMKGVPSE